ncbi:LacI family DNA-binding transcriptional regulator [Spirochaeta isovalerica]|uniref:LacI family transcriptional regulator n=1 Tax=Spirochaeta isovalerica TaxID=150 RepID=A0A841R8K4_9SPIO|nr:LacI family DNA-binding transcriptional regulator [Spirochaeta isovalerica]MBB6479289.1 LacI family transcriptional regulator [Spirochaeta isovalerica]
MATQKDVAKLANVSFITVSRVINDMGNVKEETRQRVLDAIKELNYYPNTIAQGLNRNKVRTLAIQAPIPRNVSIEETSYYRRVLIGIEKYCIEKNYDILLSTQRGDIDSFDYLKPYYERKADGIALLGARPTDEQFDNILKDNIPCVVVGDRPPGDKVYYIDTDNFRGMYEATKALIEKGHKRIAYIHGNVWTKNATDRYDGYRSAMADSGLDVKEELVYPGEFTKESGSEAFASFTSLKNVPTAILASTDLMAIGVYEAAKNSSFSIPEDISIIGFDGHEICSYTSPPLATIYQPLEEMGEECARMLIGQIEEDSDLERRKIFPVTLIPGESIADRR